ITDGGAWKRYIVRVLLLTTEPEVPLPAHVFERPVRQPRPGVPAWSLLAAFGMGAGVALGSAVIGWLLGRTAGRR
ncbi:hypothetical protein AB0C32_26275, partial [Streptosporangium sp. NPDC048865]